MNITDYLASYVGTPGSVMLYNDLKALAETDKVTAGIFKALTRFENESIRVDKAVELLASANILTDETLLKAIAELNKLDIDLGGLYDYLNPKLDPDWFTTETQSFTQVDYTVRNAGILVGIGKADYVHLDFKMVKSGCFEKIMKVCQSDELPYLTRGRVCSGFSEIVEGFLAQQGYGDASIGTASAMMYQGDSEGQGHSLIIGIEEDGKVMIADGQNDNYIWTFGDPLPYSSWDSFKIYSFRI